MPGAVNFDLAGRRALVTGAASGIGLATAELLARSGARVVLNDVALTRLSPQVERLRASGWDVHAAGGDLGDATTAATVAHAAVAQLGGLDFLINMPVRRSPNRRYRRLTSMRSTRASGTGSCASICSACSG